MIQVIDFSYTGLIIPFSFQNLVYLIFNSLPSQVQIIAYFSKQYCQLFKRNEKKKMLCSSTEPFCKDVLHSHLGNISIIKSWTQSFRRSLKFQYNCKRLMTLRIHAGYRILASSMTFQCLKDLRKKLYLMLEILKDYLKTPLKLSAFVLAYMS